MELCNSVISRLFMNSQHGFRQGKSTHTAIMEMKVLFNNLNEDVISSWLFLNYSKAFDTVNHELFLRKLHMYEFADRSLNY